jgi:LysM repeat protein
VVSRAVLPRYLAPAAILAVATAAVLIVRPALRSDASRPGAGRPPATVPRHAKPRPVAPFRQYYVIRSGDTLGGVAQQLGRSVDELLRLNPGIQPTALRPGEQIRVR